MSKVSYGKVLTYKDIEEAKKLIGKKVIGSDDFRAITESPQEYLIVGEMLGINSPDEPDYPFLTTVSEFQFIREVIEYEPQYRPYTYEEAKVFVGQMVKLKSDCLPFGVEEQIKLITSVTKETNSVQIMGVSAEIFLKKYEWIDGKPCGAEVE